MTFQIFSKIFADASLANDIFYRLPIGFARSNMAYYIKKFKSKTIIQQKLNTSRNRLTISTRILELIEKRASDFSNKFPKINNKQLS